MQSDTEGPGASKGDAEPESSETQGASEISPHELLANGLMRQLLPPLRVVQEKLDDIAKNQDVLKETVCRENEKVSSWNANREIEMYMAEVKHYHAKLVKIRKDMIQVSEKTKKMKEKSEELRNKKEKEELKRQEKERSELEKERSLIAKSSTSK